MLSSNLAIEPVVPILSSGRHRSPRQGACLMEFASYLAGERWSDHPACTHPTLASLARTVNDLTSDNRRSELLRWVHRIVGLNGDDPLLGSEIAARAGRAALPIVSMERQNALAVGLLVLDARTDDPVIHQIIVEAVATAPASDRWARRYLGRTAIAGRAEAALDALVRTSVIGIALACTEDPDARLAELLGECIEAAERRLGATTAEPAVSARQLAPTR